MWRGCKQRQSSNTIVKMENAKLKKEIVATAKSARDAAHKLAVLDTKTKNAILEAMAFGIEKRADYLLKKNKIDLNLASKKKLSKSMIDRLTLNKNRLLEMAKSLREVAKLKDPVGHITKFSERPNGLIINRMSVPIGVIGIIYESRPNVTSDCIGLSLKSGNAVILRGGKEAINSNLAIYQVLADSVKDFNLPKGSFSVIGSTDRKAVNILLKQKDHLDLIIPRGGEGLINEVVKNSRIPVIKHYKGICHTYVDEFADINTAHKIAINAKVQRPGVCNAMETLLVHEDIAPRFVPILIKELRDNGVEIRGCEKTRRIVKSIKRATELDWRTEYLDLILAIKIVSGIDSAIAHIHKYGSNHSDAIITDNKNNADKFLKEVDSACVFLNASTRFTDGNQFGMGAEIGISTDKLHARGPMALKELTTYKYVIYGTGQVRT